MTCTLNRGEYRRRLTGILNSPGNSIIGAHLDLGGHHRRAQTPGRQDGFTGRLRWASTLPYAQRRYFEEGWPKYIGSDNDPLFQYRRWTANLRLLEVEEIM